MVVNELDVGRPGDAFLPLPRRCVWTAPGNSVNSNPKDAIATAEREVSPVGFDPLSAEYLADPYPFLAAAATAAPAFYCEAIDHWVVTRYHDIRQIFRTPTLFSAANANSPLRPPCPMAVKVLEEGGFRSVPTLANVDPPAHTRVRKLANVAFTPRRVEKWSRSFVS